VAALGADSLADLKGRRVAAYPHSSSYYFLRWCLTRANLTLADIKLVELSSVLDAGRALREGRADAAAGLEGDVALAVKDREGKVLATTADAPHLISTVLVARGDFAARYPDAVRRVLRALLDASLAVQKQAGEGARLLGEVAPYLGDPAEAIEKAPPATLADNLAFFGLSGEAPVTYDELYTSAGALFVKLRRTGSIPRAELTRDLGALKYVTESRGN
jgi:ABC-type nitrate/sulfonate/bicarbonate transport system substrate-binding protein